MSVLPPRLGAGLRVMLLLALRLVLFLGYSGAWSCFPRQSTAMERQVGARSSPFPVVVGGTDTHVPCQDNTAGSIKRMITIPQAATRLLTVLSASPFFLFSGLLENLRFFLFLRLGGTLPRPLPPYRLPRPCRCRAIPAPARPPGTDPLLVVRKGSGEGRAFITTPPRCQGWWAGAGPTVCSQRGAGSISLCIPRYPRDEPPAAG